MDTSRLSRLIRRFQEVGEDLSTIGLEHLVRPLTRALGGKASPDDLASLLEAAVAHGPEYAWFNLASVCAIILTKDIPRAVEALTKLLRHNNPETRMCAAFTLAQMAEYLRHRQAQMLLELRHTAFDLLLSNLHECNFIRFEAIRALGELGDLRALEPLVALLSARDNETRWYAAHALGKLGDRRALPALRKIKRLKGAAWQGRLSVVAQLAIERIEQENARSRTP